jgi:CxxC motif-containing protein
MTKTLTCISCPIGCTLTVASPNTAPLGTPGDADAITVRGNRCSRGAVYGREEILAPRRIVTATCGVAASCGIAAAASTAPRRLPVKSSVPCPREQINNLLADIYRIRVTLPVAAGTVLIRDWQGAGIDVVAARSLD